MGFLEDLSEGLQGPENQRPDSAAEYLLGTFQNPNKLFNQSVSMASLFSPAGDGIDIAGAITGVDPISGMELAGWQRWLPAIGLTAGVGAIGVAAMSGLGQHPSMLLSAGRSRAGTGRYLSRLEGIEDLNPAVTRMADMADEGPVVGRLAGRDDVVEATPRRRIVANQIPDEALDDDNLRRLSSPNTGLEDPDRLFMTTSDFTNRVLRIDTADDVDGPVGFDKLARDVVQDADGNIDVDAAINVEAFSLTLGEKLVANIPSFSKRFNDPELNVTGGNTQLESAAWLIAQWQYAVFAAPDTGLQFKFTGRRAKKAVKDWKALKAGEAVDMNELSDVLVDFARATEHIGHPELLINPLVALRHVNLDVVGQPQFAHVVLDFEYAPINYLTEAELNRRLSAMASIHPAAITGLAADNIRMMMDMALKTDTWKDVEYFMRQAGDMGIGYNLKLADDPQEAVRIWRQWYKDVRSEIQTEATKLLNRVKASGVDPATVNPHWHSEDSTRRWLISAAAVLSAGEDWDGNVQKAVDIGWALSQNRGASIKDMHKYLSEGGLRASHGYLDAPAENSKARRLAEFILEDYEQDAVRNFMDRRYDPVEQLEAAIKVRARQNVQMGRDSAILEGGKKPWENKGSPFAGFGVLERREAKRIREELEFDFEDFADIDDLSRVELYDLMAQARQHVYHMTQQTLAEKGVPEVVTLYRGDSNVGGLPEEFLGQALMGTSTEYYTPRYFGEGRALAEAGSKEGASRTEFRLTDEEVSPHVFRFEVPRNEIIAYAGARSRRSKYHEIEANVPAEVLRRYAVPAEEAMYQNRVYVTDPVTGQVVRQTDEDWSSEVGRVAGRERLEELGLSFDETNQLVEPAPLKVKDIGKLDDLGVSFAPDGTVMMPAGRVHVAPGIKLSEDELIKVLLISGADDPQDVFRAGQRTRGLSLQQLGRELDAGTMTYAQALAARQAPGKYGALKTDAFAYSIEAQSEAERMDRAAWILEMLDGELGYKQALGEAVPGENLNRKLPVVFDRHAYKVAVGFSINPTSWINKKTGYNPLAHAYRIVAAEIGEVDGIPVLPEEIQAMTWMRQRALSHYTDPMGNPWRGKALDPSDKNKLIGQTLGYQRPQQGGSAGMVEGMGPEFMFSNNFLKFITGQFTQNLPSPRLSTQGVEVQKFDVLPSSLKMPATTPKDNLYELVYEIDPATGQTMLLNEPGASPRRNMVQSMATQNGGHVMVPRGARQVADIDEEVRLLSESTKSRQDPNERGLVGYQKHASPEGLPGDMDAPVMYIGSMVPDSPEIPILEQSRFTRFGGNSVQTHDRTASLLSKHGLEFETIDLAPHDGRSFVWHDVDNDIGPFWNQATAEKNLGKDFNKHLIENNERRQARLFVFQNHRDLSRARAILNSDATTDHVPSRAAAEYMTEFFPNRPWNQPDPQFYDSSESLKRIETLAPRAAAAYDAMPDEPSQAVLDAYEEFYRHVKNQYVWLEKQGMRVEVRDIDFENPRDRQDYYSSTYAFVKDVTENNRLIVPRTPLEGNPEIMTRIDPDTGISNNDMFRAVHDYFGHVVHENGIDRFGEDIAFMTHSQMFPEELLPVLTQETRMQNWWLHANNPAGDPNPTFPPQKLGLAPKEFWADALEFANGKGAYSRQEMRNKDVIYKDEVMEMVYYYNTDTEAPADLVSVYEHKMTDPSGGTIVTFSPSGDLNNSSTTRAYLDPGEFDLGDYATGTISGRFDAAGPGRHSLTGSPESGTLTFDNKAMVRVLQDQQFDMNTSGERAGQFKGTKGPFDVSINGDNPTGMAMYVPLRNDSTMPVIAYGEEGIAALRGEFGPERVVYVRKGSVETEVKKSDKTGFAQRSAYIIELPLPAGKSRKVDGDLFTLVNEYLSEISTLPASGRRIVPVEVAGGARVMGRY